MKLLFYIIAVAVVLGFATVCSSGSPIPDEPPSSAPPEALAPPPVDEHTEPLPFIDPPAPADEMWRLPEYGQYNPSFPYLSHEDPSLSRSVGTVTEGYLINSKPLPLPHPNMVVLPRQFDRHLQYTSDAMIELLLDAATHLAQDYPEATIPLGNFGRRGGGNIPHSVSHNNGRDADIGFFVIDDKGEPTTPPDLLSMDDRGQFVGAAYQDQNGQDTTESDEDRGENKFSDLTLDFDVERNWRLIEGLVESDAADIQYIFVSRPLRRMLLREGRRQGASAQALEIASAVLVQPGGDARPHDDHFHIRIHCNALDFAAGCHERGRRGPTFRPDHRELRKVIARAGEMLSDDAPTRRKVAIQRLHLLDDHHDHHDRIRSLIDDPDPVVRAAAVRASAHRDEAAQTIIERLSQEDSPHVVAELVNAAVVIGPPALPSLLEVLNRDDHIEFGATASVPTIAVVADGLARLEHPDAVPHLIEALADAEPAARAPLVHALRLLTNHRFAPDQALRDDRRFSDVVATWTTWWEDHGEQDRPQWVAAGFREAGYDVETLDTGAVWELCRAISETHHLNYNAQRTLKRLSGQSPNSLQWDPYDANFYWRRWFERRQDRFDLPPIPEDLSTADGYTKPE